MPLAAAFGGRNELTQDSAGVVHVVTAVGDGVYSASWNGAEWSAPEQIDTASSIRTDKRSWPAAAINCMWPITIAPATTKSGTPPDWSMRPRSSASLCLHLRVPAQGQSLPMATIATSILTPAPENRLPINTTPPNTPDPLKVVILPFLAAVVVIVGVAIVYAWKGTR